MVDLRRTQGFERTPCWDRSGSAFRDLFRRILEALDLQALNFRPYSLRRGGATYEMQSHGLMERTLIRGRWKNSNVARIYIADGLSMLPRLKSSMWLAIRRYSSTSTVVSTVGSVEQSVKLGVEPFGWLFRAIGFQ